MGIFYHNFIIFIISICLSFPLYAGDFELISDIGSSAKMIGIGNIEGFDYSSNAVFENPSNLYLSKGISSSFFTTTFLDEVKYNAISISSKFKFGTIGFGYMSKKIPEIAHTQINSDDEFDAAYFFDYSSSIFKLSYASKIGQINRFFNWPSAIDNLAFGVSTVFYKLSLDDISGTAINLDFGTHYKINNFILSGTFKNIIPSTKVSYSNSGKENLPSLFIFSALYQINTINIYYQFKRHSPHVLHSIGADYQIPYLKWLRFSLGYKSLVIQKEQKNNIVMGLELKLRNLGFNYAQESSEHILYKNKHYFSLTLDF